MTHYKTLGLKNTCTEHEIKQAYRALSFKYHPDRNNDSNASETMQQINEAYEILSDKQRRQMYDMELSGGNNHSIDHIINDMLNGGLHNMFNNRGFQGNMHHFQTGMGGVEIVFSNEIPHIFKQHRQQQPPPILEKKIDITFEDAYKGNNIPIVIERDIKMDQLSYSEEEKIYIPIYKGIDDGEIILIKEKGNIVNNIKGDLKIHIHIIPNPQYERKGLDIILRHSITFKESICGFVRELKDIDGTIMPLRSTRGVIIQNGYGYNIEKKGFTRDNQIGNLIIIFNVLPPSKHLTEDELKLFDNILL
jgi:curved DNA-binding protein